MSQITCSLSTSLVITFGCPRFLSSEGEGCGGKGLLVYVTMAGLKPVLKCYPLFNQIVSV